MNRYTTSIAVAAFLALTTGASVANADQLADIKTRGTLVCGVLSNGAPYVLPWIDHAPALIEAWMGGEAGPDAVARIILGESAPSGRLPVRV